MSAANTPAHGPIINRSPPPLDLDSSLLAAASASSSGGRKIHPLYEGPSEGSGSEEDAQTLPIPPSTSDIAKGEFTCAHPLFQDLAPADSYATNGTYWADLPFEQRQKWVNAQSNAEAKREWNVVTNMFKADPLSPLTAYSRRYVVGGFGLFTEGYT